MLTRAHVRRLIPRLGLGIGAFGVLVYLISLFGGISLSTAHRQYWVGNGACSVLTLRTGAMDSSVAIGQSSGPWTLLPSIGILDWDDRYHAITVPGWVLLGIGLVGGYFCLPAGFRPGLCAACGYSRKGILPDMACPECGFRQPPQAGQPRP